jgi:imidazolonepropionase-like amidohydrolase
MKISTQAVRSVRFVVLLTALAFSGVGQSTGAPGERKGNGTVVLKAARLIDGTGAAPITNGVVVVTNDKIAAVGTSASVTVPAGARVIDLGDVTLMPGFIDAHTHIVGRVLGDAEGQNAYVHDYDSMAAILAVANAQKTLMAGFTTIRNVGAPNFDDMAIRKAINDGWIAGPRMMTAGTFIRYYGWPLR